MRLFAIVALCLSGLLIGLTHADDKTKEKEKEKGQALTGSFKRKAGDLDLKMVLKKDNVMEYHVAIGDASCMMACKYTKDKDVYSFEVTSFEKKGDFPVNREKGYKFTMKIVSKDKKVTVSDFRGDDVSEQAKQAIEGEYETVTD